jgi:hypothetical protein
MRVHIARGSSREYSRLTLTNIYYTYWSSLCAVIDRFSCQAASFVAPMLGHKYLI